MRDELTPMKRVLDRLEDFKEKGGEVRSRCPAHNGNSDTSLAVKEGDEGRALLHCFGGCSQEEVAGALGLEMADLFPANGRGHYEPVQTVTKKVTKKAPVQKAPVQEAGPSPNGQAAPVEGKPFGDLPEGTYFEFTSVSGEVLYLQKHKGPKYRRVGDDLWAEGVAGYVEEIPYNLHELVEGVRAGKPVLWVEGCKDVDTAKEKLPQFVASTSGGATSWRPEFRLYLMGANVAIIPDNDAQGAAYAEEVAQDLSRVAKKVKVVNLLGLEDKGDLTDWLEVGHTQKELVALIRGTGPYDPEEEDPWGEPKEFDVSLPTVEPFEHSMLPPPLGEHVVSTARRMDSIPPDFVAAPLIVGAGAVLGRQVVIRPKAKDDWEGRPQPLGGQRRPALFGQDAGTDRRPGSRHPTGQGAAQGLRRRGQRTRARRGRS